MGHDAPCPASSIEHGGKRVTPELENRGPSEAVDLEAALSLRFQLGSPGCDAQMHRRTMAEDADLIDFQAGA
jgi:hypothetical protein